MKKGLAVLGVFILTIGFAVIAGAQQQTYSFKMQSTWTAGDFHHQNPTKFVEIVEKASGGRIKDQPHGRGGSRPRF